WISFWAALIRWIMMLTSLLFATAVSISDTKSGSEKKSFHSTRAVLSSPVASGSGSPGRNAWGSVVSAFRVGRLWMAHPCNMSAVDTTVERRRYLFLVIFGTVVINVPVLRRML